MAAQTGGRAMAQQIAATLQGGQSTDSLQKEQIRVIAASCVGTVFEWYDFIVFGAVAAIIGQHFLSKADPTTALIFALLVFSAGFIVRPFGALVFGRLGDLVGRKYTFLVTILIMGGATFVVGLLPDYDAIGVTAPIVLISVRLLQGLAIGGEYGGAAVFVAEHARPDKRGSTTAWIQTTATLGFILALTVVLITRTMMGEADFARWGWRIPFLLSAILLAVSVWIRLSMRESPVFLQMVSEGKTSKAPLRDAFTRWANLKLVLLAFILSSGFGVIWYTSHFYVLVFLTQTLKIDGPTANVIVIFALLFATPFFVFFGWVSDKVGRKKVILSGILLGALSLFPGFKALTHYGNPALESALATSPIVVVADPGDCAFQFNLTGTSKFTSSCDIAKAKLVAASVDFRNEAAPQGSIATVRIGDKTISSFAAKGVPPADAAKLDAAFTGQLAAAIAAAGYPKQADPAHIDKGMLMLVTFLLVFCLAVAYGPVPAMLVELFPTRIRYSSLSLPYHLGTGWFGGLVPTIAVAMVAYKGDIYFGLWFPVIVALGAVVICGLLLRETRGVDIHA